MTNGKYNDLLNKISMKDNFLSVLTTVLFLTVLAIGGALLTMAMLVVIPLALLQCMFSTTQRENEGV